MTPLVRQPFCHPSLRRHLTPPDVSIPDSSACPRYISSQLTPSVYTSPLPTPSGRREHDATSKLPAVARLLMDAPQKSSPVSWKSCPCGPCIAHDRVHECTDDRPCHSCEHHGCGEQYTGQKTIKCPYCNGRGASVVRGHPEQQQTHLVNWMYAKPTPHQACFGGHSTAMQDESYWRARHLKHYVKHRVKHRVKHLSEATVFTQTSFSS
jgi:hypothetical protein